MFRNKIVTKFYDMIVAKGKKDELQLCNSDVFKKVLNEELAGLDSNMVKAIGYCSSDLKTSSDYSELFRCGFRCIIPIGDDYNLQDLNTKMKKEYLCTFKLARNGNIICEKHVVTFQMYDSICPVKSILNTNWVLVSVSSIQTAYDENGLELYARSYDDESAFICIAGEHKNYLGLNHSNILDKVNVSYVKNGLKHELFRFIPSFTSDNLEENDIKKEIILGAYVPTHRSQPKVSLVKIHKINPNIRYVRTYKLEETVWKETIEIREGENKIAYFNGKKWVPCDTENTINLDKIVKVFSL